MRAAEGIADDIEMVIVNDGSPDNSLDLALALQRADPRVVIVDLARNFGHHKAMMTGLAHATGDLVFLIDSDLEEQPEDLALFYRRFAQATATWSMAHRMPGAAAFRAGDRRAVFHPGRSVKRSTATAQSSLPA